MKVSLVRRFVALAALAVCSLAAQAHAGDVQLGFEALYDPANGNISIRPYDASDDSPWTGADQPLGILTVRNDQSYFTNFASANIPAAAAFTTTNAGEVSWSVFNAASQPLTSYASPYDLGNIADLGLSQADIDAHFVDEDGSLGRFTWNQLQSGPNKSGRVVSTQAVPEPSTIVTLAIGGIAGLGYTARRKLRKLRKKAA